MNNNDIFNKFKNEFYENYNGTLLNLSDFKMNNRTMIHFRCMCGTEQNIQYRLILKRGTYCKKCCYSRSIQKRKKTIELNINNVKTIICKTLSNIEIKYNCVIFNKNSISHTSYVEFICSCGTYDTTLYRNIKIRGGLCRKCSNTEAHIKRTETFKEKYNSTHPANTPHIIEKRKNINPKNI
jgi:hypothetical protein